MIMEGESRQTAINSQWGRDGFSGKSAFRPYMIVGMTCLGCFSMKGISPMAAKNFPVGRGTLWGGVVLVLGRGAPISVSPLNMAGK